MKSNMMTIIKKEFARFFGDKRMVFTTIFLPGLMIYVLYTLMGNIMTSQFTAEDDYIASGYVQNMPQELELALNEFDVKWQTVSGSETEGIRESLAAQEADILLVFPENFVESVDGYSPLSAMPAPNVEIYYNSSKPESSELRSALVTYFANYEAAIANKFDVNAGNVKYDMASDKDMTGQLFAMLLPMLLMEFLFAGCNAVAPESIAGEKERGTIATLLVTPMKRSSLALGKIVSLSCIALLSGLSSFVGTMLSMPKLMGGTTGLDTSYYTAGDYGMLLGVIFSTVLLIVALVSVISAFAKSIKEASGIVSPLMILSMLLGLVPMMGATVLENTGMYCIPLFNTVLCMNSIFSFQADIARVILTIVINIVVAAALTFGLTKIFNSESAMFSK